LTPLDTALFNDNLPIAQLLLEKGANPNQGRQILTAAHHSLKMVQLLEKYGADIYKVFANELTNPKTPINALVWASLYGKNEIVAYLESKGAVAPTELPPEPPYTHKQGLLQAVKSGDVELARELFAKHPQLLRPAVFPDGPTWLELAASTGSVPMCELLIQLG